MSLSLAERSLRRQHAKGGPNPGRLPDNPEKKRCKNCPKFFLKNRGNKAFCSTECKNEFNRNGGTAYAQLKPKLEKLVRSLVREAFDEIATLREALIQTDTRLNRLESKTR